MDAPPAYQEADSFQATAEYGEKGEGAPGTAEVNPVQTAPQNNNDLRFCPSCGTPWTAGHKFCGQCGYRKDGGGGGNAPVELVVSSGLSVNQPQTVAGVMQIDNLIPVRSGNGHIIENKLFIHFPHGEEIPDRIKNKLPEPLAQKGITLEVWQDWMNRYSQVRSNDPYQSCCCMCLYGLMFITLIPFMIDFCCECMCKDWYQACCLACLPSAFAENVEEKKLLDEDINGRLKQDEMLCGTVLWPRIDPLHKNYYGNDPKYEAQSLYFMFTLTESETEIWREKKKPGELFINSNLRGGEGNGNVLASLFI